MITSLSEKINSFAGRYKQLDILAIVCARFLPYLILVSGLIFAFRSNNLYLFIVPFSSAFFSRFVIDYLIYPVYKRERPPKVRKTTLLIPLPRTPSFPSGHASFFFGFSFLFLLYNLNLGIAFLVISFINSLFRVYCGVHWFRDVVGGIIVGFLSSLIIHYIFMIWIFSSPYF